MESKNPIEHKDYLVMRHLMFRIVSDPSFAKTIDRQTDDFFEGNQTFKDMYMIVQQEYRSNKFNAPIQLAWLRTELAGRLDRMNATVEERGAYDYMLQDTYVVDMDLNGIKEMNKTTSKYMKKIRMTNAIKKAVANDLTDEAIDLMIESSDKINRETAEREIPRAMNVLDPEMHKELADQMQALLESKYPTYLEGYNNVLGGGLGRGEMGCIGAKSGNGKAEPVDTMIPTPQGIMRFGDLEVGDMVYNRFGKPVRVGAIYEQGNKRAFRVTTADGRSSVFNDEHLFSYYSLSGAGNEYLVTKSLREMMSVGVRTKRGGCRYYIPVTEALEFPEKDLPIDPYTIGALIGDGYTGGVKLELSADDRKQHIVDRIAERNGWEAMNSSSKNFTRNFKTKEGHLVRSDILPTEVIGTASTKRIPKEYLEGSLVQREELARGLFDTDGYCGIRKTTNSTLVKYYTASEGLAEDVITLLRSLGYEASLSIADRTEKEGRNHKEYIINVSAPIDKVRNLFNSDTIQKMLDTAKEKRRRYDRVGISSIEDLGYETEMRCIYVEDEEHLYVTNDYIVTHNTLHASALAVGYALSGLNVVYYALEELTPRMVHRFVKNIIGTVIQVMKNQGDTNISKDFVRTISSIEGTQKLLSEGDLTNFLGILRNNGMEIGNLYLLKYPPYTMTVADLQYSMTDLTVNQGINLDVMVIDYPDLMSYDIREGESEAGGKLFASIRGIGQEFDVITWVLTQLNRTTYGTKLYTEAHLEGSYRKQNALEFLGIINQEHEEFEAGFTRLYVAKARNTTKRGEIVHFAVDRTLGHLRDETTLEAVQHNRILEELDQDGGEVRKASNSTEKAQQQLANYGKTVNAPPTQIESNVPTVPDAVKNLPKPPAPPKPPKQ